MTSSSRGASSSGDTAMGTPYCLNKMLTTSCNGPRLRTFDPRMAVFSAPQRLIKVKSCLANVWLSHKSHLRIMVLGLGLELAMYGWPPRKVLLMNRQSKTLVQLSFDEGIGADRAKQIRSQSEVSLIGTIVSENGLSLITEDDETGRLTARLLVVGEDKRVGQPEKELGTILKHVEDNASKGASRHRGGHQALFVSARSGWHRR